MSDTQVTVACPHCGRFAVVALPADASGIGEVHTSLRYANRTTCEHCDRDFSYQLKHS